MSKPIEIDLPVRAVTAFEDRAELVREIDVELTGGSQVFVARGLTPLLAEGRVTASFDGSGAVIDEVRVEHRYAAEARGDQERLRTLQTEARVQRAVLGEAIQRRGQLQTQRGALKQSFATWTGALSRALGRGALEDGWAAGLDKFITALEVADQATGEARAEERAAQRAADIAIAAVDEAAEREVRLVADLVLRVHGETAGPQKLTVRAVVPCALWRPTHEARLSSDSALQFNTFGNVWQNTHEDWNEVSLALSTARPSAGAQLPALREDRLAIVDKSPEDKKTVHVEHRLEEVPRGGRDTSVPGVYDGGTVRVFEVDGKVSIKSDAKPHRVLAHGVTTTAALQTLAMPELDPHVVQKATFTNTGHQPILAGPVTLIREGSYVGLGEIAYVGPGDEGELSFGSDDRYQLKYEKKRFLERRRVVKDRVHFAHEVRVSFTGEGAGELTVLHRMPVSELKQVRVIPSELHALPPDPVPDAHGIVRTPLTVRAGEPETVRVAFYFDTSSDVSMPDPW